MAKHLIDKNQELLLSIAFLEKRAKSEERAINRLLPKRKKILNKLINIESSIRTHNNFYRSYIKKRDELIASS